MTEPDTIPDEPTAGTTVTDRDGNPWEAASDSIAGELFWHRPGEPRGWTWPALWHRHGPLTWP